jgi:hypothetical protein
MDILGINSNDYFTSRAGEFSVIINNEKELEAVKSTVEKMDVVSIKRDDGLVLFHFSETSEYGPKIDWINEIDDKEDYNIVLGKDFYKEFVKSKKAVYEQKLGNSSILCNVAGVLKTTKFDYKEFSNYVLMDLNSNNRVDFNGVYRIDGDRDFFIKSLKNAGIEFKENDLHLLSLSGSRFLSVQSIFGMIILLLFIFAMLLIVKLWFGLFMKEVGVRIAFGGRGFNLLIDILYKYLLVVTIGIFWGLSFFFLYFKFFLYDLRISSLLNSFLLGVGIVFGINFLAIFFNFYIFSKKSIREILEQ